MIIPIFETKLACTTDDTWDCKCIFVVVLNVGFDVSKNNVGYMGMDPIVKTEVHVA